MRLALNAWFWDSATTGSGQYTRQLAHALENLHADPEVVLVVPSPGGEGREEREGMAFPASCLPHAVPCTRSRGAKVQFEQVIFPRACTSLGADVAHVPYWGSPLRPSVPTVVTIHDLIPLMVPGYRGGLLQRLYTALVSAAARRAAVVLTDSKASQEDILSQLKLPRQRVRAVPLAVDDRYSPEPDPSDGAVRNGYGLPERYILYLGGFDRRKNLVTVFAAYRRACQGVEDAHPLVIAGRLPEEDSAFAPHPRRLMLEQGVPEQWVHYAGFVREDDKPAVYRGASAFMFPSRYEGFGLPALEALACGTPVVGSDAGSLPEIVGDGGTLLSPDDAEGMGQGLMRLMVNESYRSEMHHRALAQAAKFSWQHTAEETLAAYRHARR